jgi:ribosomal protein S18 acetylase RimI-like enzyme
MLTISTPLVEDAESISNIIKKSWYVTYVKPEIGVTERDVDFLYSENEKGQIESLKERAINPKDDISLVAKEDGKVLGYIRFKVLGDEIELRTLYVLPEETGKRIGTKLWEEGFKLLPKARFIITEPVKHTKAIDFYKKLGFVDTGERYPAPEAMADSGAHLPLLKMVYTIKAIGSKEYVYHGSPIKFDSEHAIPKRNIRSRLSKDGEQEVIFDQESFHATPYKWIALAYTYSAKPQEIEGKTAHYNVGVSLYNNTKEVDILGFNSLEESLKKLYGTGGYLYYFGKDKFIFKEGLGDLEVITEEKIKPISVERIDNPVEEMKKLGVAFKFVDLALPENEKHRNYY